MAVHNEHAQFEIATDTAAETANTDRNYQNSFLLPGKWQITKVVWLPDDAVTADGTNYAVLTLTNETQAQTIASRSYAATNSVAGAPEVLTTPAGAASVVSENDVLRLAKTTPGTGVAVRGRMVLALERRPL